MELPEGTRGNPDGDILIVGEAYGANEARQNKPFVGASGKELNNMLAEAGIDQDQCLFTNVVNKQPAGNNMTKFFIPTKEARDKGVLEVRGLYPDIPALQGLMALDALISEMKPKVIIAFGNYSLWALTEDGFKIGNGSRKAGSVGFKVPTGITQFRGSHLRTRDWGDIPVVPTYHPAAILRNWEWRFPAVHDLRARTKLALEGRWNEPERNYIIRPSLDVALSTLNDLTLRASLSKTPLLISCDIETLKPHIECVGFAWSKTDAICIPIMCRDNWDGYWTAEEEMLIVQAMRNLLTHPNVEVVGQNFFYDFQYLFYYWMIKPNYKQDTMLAHHTCFPGTRMGLDYLSSMYCEYHRYWKDDGKEASKHHDDEQRWIYNCRDCVVTYECIEEIWKIIKYFGLEQQYAIQMKRATSAIGMMLQGIRVDQKRKAEERLIHMNAAVEYQAKLEEFLPETLYPRPKGKKPWYGSPQQLAHIFYEVLNQKPIINRSTGSLTTDEDALKTIKLREPLLAPFIDTLLEYRSLSTFGQFVNMKLGPDNRMRAMFSPTTSTFRYRSSEDVFGYGRNLQNLPKGNEDELS